MNYPLHIKLRRTFSSLFISLLSCFTRNKQSAEEFVNLSPEEIHSIVIIRPNYRIGNLIFLTPLINELAKHFPDASVDIIVGSRGAGSVLQNMPNVDSIFDIPRKLLFHPFKLFSYIQQTRQKKYDVAINISSGSLSAQIVLSLINTKYKVGFYGKKTWANYTHLQERKPKYKHMGLEPLDFLTFFHLSYPKETPQLDIKLTPFEIEMGKQEFDSLLVTNQKVVAIFRGARFDKKIEDEWWEELTQLLIKRNISVIDILSPDIPEKLNEQVIPYSNKNLRVLGAFLRQCNCFLCADTGPMHLASASGANVIALFKFNNSDTYGTLGENNKTINLHTTPISTILQIIHKEYL